MHYKDGTEAKVGDLVKGTTYNTPKGSVHVGVMMGITPGSSACNCRVLIPMAAPAESMPDGVYAVHTGDGPRSVFIEYAPGGTNPQKFLVGGKVDSSQCDHLELVHRPAG